ncbi:MAG TPA: DUF4133 domain-containing protein [Puia sp.]|nr:DUF4133 domain-containing protein [Puia sp.]
MYTVFKVHRRVNAPVEFKGLKGQYILYAGASVIACMVLFAILYLVGVNSYICLPVCFGIGALCIGRAFHLSQHYGIYGWRKRRRARASPGALKSGTRRVYLALKK